MHHKNADVFASPEMEHPGVDSTQPAQPSASNMLEDDAELMLDSELRRLLVWTPEEYAAGQPSMIEWSHASQPDRDDDSMQTWLHYGTDVAQLSLVMACQESKLYQDYLLDRVKVEVDDEPDEVRVFGFLADVFGFFFLLISPSDYSWNPTRL